MSALSSFVTLSMNFRLCTVTVCSAEKIVSQVVNRRSLAFFKRKWKSTDHDVDSNSDGPTPDNKYIDSATQKHTTSLSQYGSRENKVSYTPPVDTESRIERIVQSVCGETEADWKDVSLDNAALKNRLLTLVMRNLNHDVPSCDLNQMRVARDLLDYFSRPMTHSTTYDDLDNLPIPRNLHIQQQPVRFDPRTDALFNGLTAFPGRPTIVTSLKHKHKYTGTHVDDTLPEGYIPRKGDE